MATSASPSRSCAGALVLTPSSFELRTALERAARSSQSERLTISSRGGLTVEILVIVVVHAAHRRAVTGAEALGGPLECGLPSGGRLAGRDVEILAQPAQEPLGAATAHGSCTHTSTYTRP